MPDHRPAKRLVPATSADALAHAHHTLHGDWDADGTTVVYLPAATGGQLLSARAWTEHPDGSWRAPSGERVWHTSDALQLALTAETDPAPSMPERDGPRLRRTADRQLIHRELLDDLITTILGHDALLDSTDDLLFDHLVTGDPTPADLAAALPRLITDTLAAATPEDWQRHANQLITDINDIDTAPGA